VKRLVVEYWTPLILWLFTMFFFSTDQFSTGQTSKVIVPILMFFFPSASSHQLHIWHEFIRKFSHISEYFILAFLTYRIVQQEQQDLIKPKVVTILVVLLAAMFDELHQRFTASRNSSLIDVGYDCLGAVWALCFIASYEIRRLRTHSIL
jgi:VanZ family protein